jgi:hypothetical protein
MRMPVMMVGVALLGVVCSAQSEERPNVLAGQQSPPVQLTGNARIDFVGQTVLTPSLEDTMQQQALGDYARKSPWIAGALSLVVPGTGEFYAASYWKAALFLAADVALWAAAYSYDKRGDRQTDIFQDYANTHWSVVRYALYARETLAPPDGNYSDLFIPGTQDRPAWEQVNWSVLNAMERAIGGTAQGQYYSHALAPYNDQQYYEMIGKYPQFNQGWDDAPSSFQYGDPVTARFHFYSSERAKANDYYTTASTFVTVAVVNHVLSAADAAWSASSYRGVHAQIGFEPLRGSVDFVRVPTLKVVYAF